MKSIRTIRPSFQVVQKGHPFARNLAVAWNLTEGRGTTAYDASGHGFHGTLRNGPFWSGQGVVTDGVDQDIHIAQSFGSPYGASVTFRNATDVTTASGGYLLAFNTNTHAIALGPVSGTVSNEVISVIETSGTTDVTSVQSITIPAGLHNVTVLWSSSLSRYRIFLDGIEQSVVAGSNGHAGLVTSGAAILSQNGSGAVYGAFTFYDLKVWNAEMPPAIGSLAGRNPLALYEPLQRIAPTVINIYQRSMVDTVEVQDSVALAFFHSMVDTIEVSDQIKLTWIQSLSDSVGLEDTISAVMTFVNAVSDQVNVADSVNNILKALALAEDTVEMSEVINARGVFIRSLSDSIETSITINVSGVEYVGLVLNTTNMAISTYAGWDFNSFAEIDGNYIGAGREGVYELGGEDDDGTDIEWEIDFGNIDFGNSQDKRLPEIFYACRSDGTILFKVTHVLDDGAKVENWYQATRTSDALTERRVKLKKGVKSQYYRVELMGKDGSSIDLEKIELTPMVLMRKL